MTLSLELHVDSPDAVFYSDPHLQAIHMQKQNYFAKRKANPYSRPSPTGVLPAAKRRRVENGQIMNLSLSGESTDSNLDATLQASLEGYVNSAGSSPAARRTSDNLGVLFQQGRENLTNGAMDRHTPRSDGSPRAADAEGDLTRSQKVSADFIKGALVAWDEAPYTRRWVKKAIAGEQSAKDKFFDGENENESESEEEGDAAPPKQGAPKRRGIADDSKQEALGAELKFLPQEKRLMLVNTRLQTFNGKNVARCLKIFATEPDAYCAKDRSLPQRDEVFHRLLQNVMKDKFGDDLYSSKDVADVCFSIAKFYVEQKSVAWRSRNKAAMGMGRVIIDNALQVLRFCSGTRKEIRRAGHVYCCSGSELHHVIWAAYKMERTGNPNLERLIAEVLESQWRNFSNSEMVQLAHYMIKLREFNEDMISSVVNRFRADVRKCPDVASLLAVAIEGQSPCYVALLKQVPHFFGSDANLKRKLLGSGFSEVLCSLGLAMRESGCEPHIWEEVEKFSRFAFANLGLQSEVVAEGESFPKSSGKLMIGMGSVGVCHRPFLETYMRLAAKSDRKIGHDISSRYFQEVAQSLFACNLLSHETVIDAFVTHAESVWDSMTSAVKCQLLFSLNGLYFNSSADLRRGLGDEPASGSMNKFLLALPAVSRKTTRRLRSFVCSRLPKMKEIQIMDRNQLDEDSQGQLGFVALCHDQITKLGLSGKLGADSSGSEAEAGADAAQQEAADGREVTTFMSPPQDWKDHHKRMLLETIERTVAEETNEVVSWVQNAFEMKGGVKVERLVLVDELLTVNLRINDRVCVEVLNPKCGNDISIDCSARDGGEPAVLGGGMVLNSQSPSGSSNLRRVLLESVCGHKLYSISTTNWEERRGVIQAELEALVASA